MGVDDVTGFGDPLVEWFDIIGGEVFEDRGGKVDVPAVLCLSVAFVALTSEIHADRALFFAVVVPQFDRAGWWVAGARPREDSKVATSGFAALVGRLRGRIAWSVSLRWCWLVLLTSRRHAGRFVMGE